MNNNLKILRFFVEHKDEGFSIKKIAELLKMNYKIAYEEIMDLEKEGSINITKQGNSNICTFSHRYSGKIVEIEESRKKALNSDIKLIRDRIKDTANPMYCLILFGSYANKTNKKESDIDLCLITESKEISKQVNDIVAITPLKIHLLEFTPKQFLQMLKSREYNVGNEIVKNNIILSGIEQFYMLVNYVKR